MNPNVTMLFAQLCLAASAMCRDALLSGVFGCAAIPLFALAVQGYIGRYNRRNNEGHTDGR